MRHRSSLIRLATDHCNKALTYYHEGRPANREAYYPGVAAHMLCQLAGEAAKTFFTERLREPDLTEWQAILDATLNHCLYRLTSEGYFFADEPPQALPAEAVVVGTRMAYSSLATRPLNPRALYEHDWAVTDERRPVVADSREAWLGATIDVVEAVDVEDESIGGVIRTIFVTDYKSSWQAKESELETLQRKIQAIVVWANRDRLLGGADCMVLRIVNLRTGITYDSFPIWAGNEGEALLKQYWDEARTICDALDHLPRMALPGPRCIGCPYVLGCEDAQEMAQTEEATLYLKRDHAVRAYCAAKARLEALKPIVQDHLDKCDPVTLDGHQVGYVTAETMQPVQGAARTLAEEWIGGNLPRKLEDEQWLSLLQALQLRPGNYKAAGKVLFPRGTEGWKDARKKIEATLLESKPVVRFVIK